MNEIVLELISQFGISGVILALVGYIAYNGYKSNLRREAGEDGSSIIRRLVEQVNAKLDSFEIREDKFEERIMAQEEQSTEDRIDLRNRLDDMEKVLNELKNPNPVDVEARNVATLSKRYPMIHKILGNSMDNIKCDHIAIGHVHNGSKGITGIPFIKCTIVAERYDPIKNPGDVELGTKYKGEDLMRHNLLPAAVMQHDYAHFDVYKGAPLEDVDSVTYQQCLKKGIKELAFHSLKTHDGLLFGFVVCYSFKERELNEAEIKQTVTLLEEVYSF